MNIFVAFFVLLLLLAESTPPAASSIPLIGLCLIYLIYIVSWLQGYKKIHAQLN